MEKEVSIVIHDLGFFSAEKGKRTVYPKLLFAVVSTGSSEKIMKIRMEEWL